MKDLTFSNGVRIPAGTILTTPAISTHRDAENYADPNVFDPFRHINLRDESVGTDGLKHQFVSTASNYVAFGIGKHAWYVSRAYL